MMETLPLTWNFFLTGRDRPVCYVGDPISRHPETSMQKRSRLRALLTVPLAVALFVATAGAASAGTNAAANDSPTSYVNPFIGTDPAPNTGYGFGFDTGDVFPGAAYPAGML